MRFLSALLVLITSTQVAGQTYCSAGPTSTQDSNLGAVTLNGDSKNINDPSNCPGVVGTQDKTAMHADLVPGNTYSLGWEVTTCGGPYNRRSVAWIDYNGNTVFDPDEQIGQVQSTGNVATEHKTVSFTVPADTTLKSTRMRVSCIGKNDVKLLDSLLLAVVNFFCFHL
jgi:hypothetical protein